MLVSNTVLDYNAAWGNLETQIQESFASSIEAEASALNQWLSLQVNQMNRLASSYMIKNGMWDTQEYYLSGLMDTFEDFEQFFIADNLGDFKAIGGATGNVGQEGYFSRALNGEAVIRGPLHSEITGTDVLIVAVPFQKGIYDDTGSRKGVIAV